jgi:hypothetical protein
MKRLMSAIGTDATFPDGRRKADISPKPDIAGLLSMLVYEFTPQLAQYRQSQEQPDPMRDDHFYLVRFQTVSVVPPIVAAGLCHVSSSAAGEVIVLF